MFVITSRVPQGHLSSLLFLLSVNDLDKVLLYDEYVLFVDDLKLYKT